MYKQRRSPAPRCTVLLGGVVETPTGVRVVREYFMDLNHVFLQFAVKRDGLFSILLLWVRCDFEFCGIWTLSPRRLGDVDEAYYDGKESHISQFFRLRRRLPRGSLISRGGLAAEHSSTGIAFCVEREHTHPVNRGTCKGLPHNLAQSELKQRNLVASHSKKRNHER